MIESMADKADKAVTGTAAKLREQMDAAEETEAKLRAAIALGEKTEANLARRTITNDGRRLKNRESLTRQELRIAELRENLNEAYNIFTDEAESMKSKRRIKTLQADLQRHQNDLRRQRRSCPNAVKLN